MVKIIKSGFDESNNVNIYDCIDIDNNDEQVVCKNWYEKSKDKYHVVLGPNTANRKYIAHNEIEKNLVDNEYVVADKTSGPRRLGTSEPHKKLVPYMTEEDKAAYEEIIGRAKKNKEALAPKKSGKSEEEKFADKLNAFKAKYGEEAFDKLVAKLKEEV